MSPPKGLDDPSFLNVASDHIDILGLFTPLNQQVEMQKWLSSPGKTYNPQFVYDESIIRANLNRAKKLRKSLPKITERYASSSDWRSILTYDFLTSLRTDLDATISLLDALRKNSAIEHDFALKATNQLFGEVTKDEYNLAVDLAYQPALDVFQAHLPNSKDRYSFSPDKFETVLHNYLHDFNGRLSESEAAILRGKQISEKQIDLILEQVMTYMFSHSDGEESVQIILQKVSDTDHFGIMPHPLETFTYEIHKPFVANMPDGKLDALTFLQIIAHEINTHLRVMISTETLTRSASPYFLPGILMRGQRSLSIEGFAVLNGDAYLENSEGDVLEALTIIVPDYIRQGHNFAETAKYIYEIYDLDPDINDPAIHHTVWTILQSFIGARDTSAHSGYAFPYHQVYLLGVMRILKELSRVDKNTFEDPLSLMRYSELPLDMLNTINHIEHDLGEKLVKDPFEIWDFANFNPSIPDPASYAKQLLLEL